MIPWSTSKPGANKLKHQQRRGRLSDHCRRQRQLLFPAEGARSIRTAAARADAAARALSVSADSTAARASTCSRAACACSRAEAAECRACAARASTCSLARPALARRLRVPRLRVAASRACACRATQAHSALAHSPHPRRTTAPQRRPAPSPPHGLHPRSTPFPRGGGGAGGPARSLFPLLPFSLSSPLQVLRCLSGRRN